MSSSKALLEGFRKLWAKINVPGSCCPDVEIGYVSDLMVDILAESNSFSPLTPEQLWVLSYIQLRNQASLMDVGMSYAQQKVEQYVVGEKDEYGYPKRRDYDDIEKDEGLLIAKIEQTSKELINMGILKLEEDFLRLV